MPEMVYPASSCSGSLNLNSGLNPAGMTSAEKFFYREQLVIRAREGKERRTYPMPADGDYREQLGAVNRNGRR